MKSQLTFFSYQTSKYVSKNVIILISLKSKYNIFWLFFNYRNNLYFYVYTITTPMCLEKMQIPIGCAYSFKYILI